jgi:ATP-binding protein involved in chromosome partitioning
MGPLKFRTYRDVAGEDRSGLLEQVTAQRERVGRRLADVHRIVAVMSGKGGVGKSFVTAALARAIARQGKEVGVLDADLRSPTVARLLDARGPLVVGQDAVEPASGADNVRVISTDLLLAEGRPLAWREPGAERFVWRGALELSALREFLGDVAWGALDMLLVDLPPGADGVVDLHALVPGLTGAIVVTIPTDEARRSVARTMQAAREDGITLVGIIENMSGYACPGCGALGPLFQGDAGRRLSDEFDVPLLGAIPFQSGFSGSGSSLPPDVADAVLSRLTQVLP